MNTSCRGSLGLCAAAGLLALGALVPAATSAPASTFATCAASRVTYTSLASVERGLHSLPRVAVGPARDRLYGFLFYYPATPWGRSKDPLARIYAGGESPDGHVNMKILWQAMSHLRTRWLLVDGTRLDGEGTFRQGFRGYGRFSSIVEIPSPGCWRLDVRVGTGRATLTFAAE